MKLSSPLQATLLCVLLLSVGSSRPTHLQVEYAGCDAVLLRGPVCQLSPERELRLWTAAPPEARIEIRADGRRIEGDIELVQDGKRISLKIPPGAEKVDVLVETQEGRASWSLSFAELDKQEMSRDVIHRVEAATNRVFDDIQAGRLAAALKTLDGIALPPEAPAKARFLVVYYRSLLAEREGDYRSALDEIEQAVEIAERVKSQRFQRLTEQKQALLLRAVGRSRDAVRLFERLRHAAGAADACAMGELLTNQAWTTLLAREAGESFEDPAPLLEKALARYETCADVTSEERANILINLALAHLQEGRLPQAKGFLARAHGIEPDPPLRHLLWWLDLEARIALREDRPTEALHQFKSLERLAREAGSADGRLRAAFGQARSQQALGDRATALETLRQAEALLDEQSLQVPVHEGRELFVATRQATVSLLVEILLDEGRNAEALDVARRARSRVLRQLERSDRLASLTPEQRARWGNLLMEYQERRTALEARAADDGRLPEDRLRYEKATREAEAEAGKKLLDQAFLILGVSGEPSGSELSAPRSGELILAYHPLTDGWAGFAANGEVVAAHRFTLPPAVLARREELAVRLLLPFRDEIRKARRLRILASGPLQTVDFHTLPFDGDVLLASHPVVYGLDLPPSTSSTPTPGGHALLVVNPRDDLPGALDEARAVRKVLGSNSRSWTTEELEAAEASPEAVQSRLPAADLLHYAGHGIYSGAGGWESSLLLSQGTHLTLGDILALEQAPAWVVLSGCDTGRSSSEMPIEGLGLAHAFLLAGSRAVVASTRPANDRTVAVFFPELYRRWDREQDLAVALQRAQLAWRQQNPRADWSGFRLFEP
jgi:cellulose synthase operon protein C